MTAKIFDIESYPFSDSEKYLLDANVWLAVYGPNPPKDQRARRYSDALKRLRIGGAPIFIDVLVTSELVNRWSRLAYRQAPDPKPEFKAYRGSAQFALVADEIGAAASAIFKFAKRTGTPFANTDIDAIFRVFGSGVHDFNDQLLAEKCRLDDMLMVSDDADMGQYDIRLITGNPKLLATK